ncbi:hypothetical protein PTKU15_01830 [Paraburkholderia terrae]|nr:hypothetical protein PTKU15_01830 [Paraburkholderia terrae]
MNCSKQFLHKRIQVRSDVRARRTQWRRVLEKRCKSGSFARRAIRNGRRETQRLASAGLLSLFEGESASAV